MSFEENLKRCLLEIRDAINTFLVNESEGFQTVSGGPEKGADAPANQLSSSPQRRHQPSRKPTQTVREVLGDLYSLVAEVTIDALNAPYVVRLLEYDPSGEDWREINRRLNTIGYEWISAGKDSRWEKQ